MSLILGLKLKFLNAILTLKAPSKMCSRPHYIFLEKISLDISCKSSAWASAKQTDSYEMSRCGRQIHICHMAFSESHLYIDFYYYMSLFVYVNDDIQIKYV